jgi:histidyl-tRNA synthetase
VRQLLGKGRKDESGDFTKGAGLGDEQISALTGTFSPFTTDWQKPFAIEVYEKYLKPVIPSGAFPILVEEGLEDLERIRRLVRVAGYKPDRIRIDPSVVRGLEYYTGAVFEAELTFEVTDDDGRPVRFGSVGGGGRYDGLVGRFRGEDTPATGFSIGVSRLQAALAALNRGKASDDVGPVVVTVMEKDRIGDYQRMVSRLREAGIAAELYLGDSGFRAQMKYADRRNAPVAVIQGGDEKAKGVVQIKDLAAGKAASQAIADNTAWREERPGQFEVGEDDLVAAVRRIVEARR